MGSVAMGSGGGYWFKGGGGVYVGIKEECIYCDKCGSFKITKRPTFQATIWVAVALLISAIIWKTSQNVFWGNEILCFAVLLLWMSGVGIFKVGYACKKCGNIHITHGNVLSNAN